MAIPLKGKEDKITLREWREKKKLFEEGKTLVGFRKNDKDYIEHHYKIHGELPQNIAPKAMVSEGDYEWRNRSKVIVEEFRRVLQQFFNGVISRAFIMQEIDVIMKEEALKKARSIAMAGRFLRMNRTTFIESLKAQGIWDARSALVGAHHVDALEDPQAFELTRAESRRSREEMLRYVASQARKDRSLSEESLRILRAVENLKREEERQAHYDPLYEPLDIKNDPLVEALLRNIGIEKPMAKVTNSSSSCTGSQKED